MKNCKSNNSNEETPLLPPISTSMYPFRNNRERFDIGLGDYVVTEEARMVFEKTVGLPVNKARLKAFLVQKCKIRDPINYSFPDIIEALRLHIENNCDENSVDKSPTSKEIEKNHKSKDSVSLAKTNEPLSDKALAVLNLLQNLPPNNALIGRLIIDELSKKNIFLDQSALTKSIIPALKPHGVKNKPRVGYYIEKK